ncbi:MAG: proline racemase family protein [Anaerolineae bacterium]|jgi:proline racemase
MFSDKIEAAFHQLFKDSILTIDAHVAGEPARLVVGGLPSIPGQTINDKRLYLSENLDDVRLRLTREPRGHRDMFAAVLTEAESEDAAFGLVYMDARRYPYLCGHATIAAVSALIELGFIEAQPPKIQVVVDTPSGPWRTTAYVRRGTAADGRRLVVDSVCIRPEIAFAYLLDQPLDVPGLGRIQVDVSFTGGFFVMVSIDQIGLALTADNAHRLAQIGMAIIEASNEQLSVQHPERTYINTIDVVEIFDPRGHDNSRGKNFVVLGEGHVDRSPCGTGTCAKMALLHRRGELAVGQTFVNEGFLGTTFDARIVRETTVEHLPAIIPEVCGTAYLTGLNHFVLAPGDPFLEGFLL